jgi:hypothetical protein
VKRWQIIVIIADTAWIVLVSLIAICALAYSLGYTEGMREMFNLLNP